MSANILNLLGAVVLVVLGVQFGSEIIGAAATILGHEDVDDFLGLSIVGSILPTIYYIAILGLAGSIATGVAPGAVAKRMGLGNK